MSIVYADASVEILKYSVWPMFTLMSVAKPWMVGSPTPVTSQTLSGVPGLEFSQTIGLLPGPHGDVAAEAAGCAASSPPAAKAAAAHTRATCSDLVVIRAIIEPLLSREPTASHRRVMSHRRSTPREECR